MKVFKVTYWAFGLQSVSIVAAPTEEKAEIIVSTQLNKEDDFTLESVCEIDLSRESIVYTEVYEAI